MSERDTRNGLIDLAQTLSLRRQELGWTIPTAAQRAGVPRKRINDLEKGMRRPSADTLVAVCRAYGLAPAQILRQAGLHRVAELLEASPSRDVFAGEQLTASEVVALRHVRGIVKSCG